MAVCKESLDPELWDTPECEERVKIACLVKWHKTEHIAKQYAKTVRAELLMESSIRQAKGIPTEEHDPIPIEVEKQMPVTEILEEYHKTLPPIPKTDFKEIPASQA